MSKMIQIRNVPDDVHHTLKVRAAQEGRSLSDYLLEEVSRVAARPTMEEIRERLERQSRGNLSGSDIAALIREDRGPLPPE